MEIYAGTTKLKTDVLSVTKAIGSLLITSSRKVHELTTETITIIVERSNGNNVIIANRVPLKHYVLGSLFGSAVASSDTGNVTQAIGFSALCELAENGDIPLAENERIKISLEGLLSAQYYSVNGLPFGMVAQHIYSFDTKTILSEQKERRIDTLGSSLACISNFDKVTEMEINYNNGVSVKYDNKELLALIFDVDNVVAIDKTGAVVTDNGNTLLLPLGDTRLINQGVTPLLVESINVFKPDTLIDITLMQ